MKTERGFAKSYINLCKGFDDLQESSKDYQNINMFWKTVYIVVYIVSFHERFVICQRRNNNERQSRRQRILSILESYQEATAPTFRAARFDFSGPVGRSGVASDRAISHYRSGWSGRTPDPGRTTPLPTVEPPESPYDLWYYRDDSNYTQGPFSSPTMLEWQKAGYFRPGLLLRREVDNIFSNLATYTSLYGRSPFTSGSYPRAIIVRTTTTAPTSTTTTTKTTTTSKSTTVKTTTLSTVSTSYFAWQTTDIGQTSSVRGDGIDIEDDEDATDIKDGSLRLVNGHEETDGNLEVYHDGVWGGVCDDEWDEYDAKVVCRQLGYPGSLGITNGGRYGYTPDTIWMDNVYCYGTEKRLEDCRFEGWGIHDCDRTEAAGVRCKPHPPPSTTTTTTTPRPKIPIVSAVHHLDVRLAGGRTETEGRVELRLDHGEWGVACGDGWGLREAVVVCRELGLGYAAAAMETDMFGGGNMTRVISGVGCVGHEDTLLDCGHDSLGDIFCPGQGYRDIAAVVCTPQQADLQPDLYQLMTSAYLEDKPLALLQCAMEENCLASAAYTEKLTNHYWQQASRRLLRFTTAISNIGNADFRPFIPKDAWQWHACHQVCRSHIGKQFQYQMVYDYSTTIQWRYSHILRLWI